MNRRKKTSTRRGLRLGLSCIIVFAVIPSSAAQDMATSLDAWGPLPPTGARTPPPAFLAEPDAATRARVIETYGKLPLSFEANQGQTDGQVKFLSRGRGYTLFLTPTEAVLVLRSQQSAVGRPRRDFGELSRAAQSSRQQSAKGDKGKKTEMPGRTVLRMQLASANAHPKIEGLDELPGKSNYFIGNHPKKWHTNVPNYARVRYQDVYPGVDLIYYGNRRQLEYDFVVAPGADPGDITLTFQGADQVEMNDRGDLVFHTAGGKAIQHAPVIYQEINGARQTVNGHFVLRDKQRVGFHVANYDVTKPLIIDPELIYSSFLGGSLIDVGNDVAVDATGNAYVTGTTDTSELDAIPFPTTMGAFDTTFNGISDAFVTKVNAAGDMLVYSTYLGGGGTDGAFGIAVNGLGEAYVTGVTNSTGATPFPTTAGTAFQGALGGLTDAFVTKLNAAGSGLLYSTYLGGSLDDQGNGIAVDTANNAYVTGFTESGGATAFPTSPGAFDTVFNGIRDAFVAKFDPSQAGPASRIYSTYLGSSGSDEGMGMAVDGALTAYVTGVTDSGAVTPFPTTLGAFDTTPNGVQDAFVTRFNVAGTALDYSTYLGGSLADVGNDIVADAARIAYVIGTTDSGGATPFPTTMGAFDTTLGGLTDAFVAKIDPSGNGANDLLYSTFLGGSLIDRGNGIAVDGVGPNAYGTGSTDSDDFPTAGTPFQATRAGLSDAFVAKIDPAGNGANDLVYSTYLGGSLIDLGNGIAVDPVDDAYVVGSTNSGGATPFPTASFQNMFGGVTDAFISKVEETAAAPPGGGGGGGGDDPGIDCAVIVALGPPSDPPVQVLREFRDRYLLTNGPGRLLVAVYYRTSPAIAKLIAESETLRTIVRVGLLPIVGWAVLILRFPDLALGILLLAIGLGTWLAIHGARRRPEVRASRDAPHTGEYVRSGRRALRRGPALLGCILFVLALAALVEADQRERPPSETRVDVVGDVRLPHAMRFALIRDLTMGRLGLYKDGEAIFVGHNPLPVGKIAAVHDEVLVLALPGGRTIEIPRGGRLPGPHRLVFARTALIDTLRFQIRVGGASTADRNYSVVDISSRRAILERDAIPGKDQTATRLSVVPEPQRGQTRAPTVAEVVNRIPFTEVGPDTWEVPERNVKELGNHLWPLLSETLRSAAPVVTMSDGVGLRLNTSLGTGTLDRQGFRIDYAKMARRTGLEVGDRILSVNDQPVNSAGGLVRIYKSLKSDGSLSEVNLVIKRNEELRTLTYRIR